MLHYSLAYIAVGLGFQPWLGSGAVLLFLIITMQSIWGNPYVSYSAIWFQLFSPIDITAYLFPNLFLQRYKWELLENLQFFYLPVGNSLLGLVSVHLLNYGFWIYFLWQGIIRCFRNSNTSLLSKSHSYFLVACTQVLLWGFTLQYGKNYSESCMPGIPGNSCEMSYDVNDQISDNFPWILVFNVVLFFGLLATLTPHRQTVQDWARYRHQNISGDRSVKNNFWLNDLIWGEKSPIPVSAFIYLAIATTPVTIWILLLPIFNNKNRSSSIWMNQIDRFNALLGVVMLITIMMICAAIVQRAFLMKTKYRFLWAFVILVALFFLLPIALEILYLKPSTYPTLWLFSTWPWVSLEYSSTPTVFIAWLAELAVLGLLVWQLVKHVKILGESTTKVLLVKD
ncbi:hypothetical protein AB0758_27745 [Tolypothrix bouteillei VB521301_2]|uniref:hypothetical protein n=1 Tax=Tolypothrix bouteillei TaxID=1246981 RepID=UPI0038B46EF1